MLRSALTTAALAVFLVVCAPAHATSGTLAGMNVALAKWGMPTCGQPHVEVATPAAYGAAHDSSNFGGQTPLAWADESRCVIVINRDLAHLMIHTPVKRCDVIVHEWGHLAGYRHPSNVADPDHSDNVHSVMYGGDNVGEAREWLSRKRWRWVTTNAYHPCYAAVRKD